MKRSVLTALACAGFFSLAFAQQGQSLQKVLEASTAWDGDPLTYPQGKPLITSIISTLEPKGFTRRHMHPVPTYIYVLEGTLVVDVDGKSPREVKAGEAFMEVVGPWHRNRNPSSKEKVRYMLVFMGTEKEPYVKNE